MPHLTPEEIKIANDMAEGLLRARKEALEAMADPEEGLPEHKRSGYAERMYEHADMERKRRREEGGI